MWHVCAGCRLGMPPPPPLMTMALAKDARRRGAGSETSFVAVAATDNDFDNEASLWTAQQSPAKGQNKANVPNPLTQIQTEARGVWGGFRTASLSWLRCVLTVVHNTSFDHLEHRVVEGVGDNDDAF